VSEKIEVVGGRDHFNKKGGFYIEIISSNESN
jgi:hypothetical protein